MKLNQDKLQGNISGWDCAGLCGCLHCQACFSSGRHEINKLQFVGARLFIDEAYCHLLNSAFCLQERQRLFHVSEHKANRWLEAKAVSDQKGNYCSCELIAYQDQLMQWCLNNLTIDGKLISSEGGGGGWMQKEQGYGGGMRMLFKNKNIYFKKKVWKCAFLSCQLFKLLNIY